MTRIVQILIRLSGLGITILSLWYGFHGQDKVENGGWMHAPSFVLVFGCIFGYSLASYQFTQIVDAIGIIFKRSPSILEKQLKDLGRSLQGLSEDYNIRGSIALQPYAQNSAFPEIWRNILSQLEAKIPPTDVRILLQYDARRKYDHLGTLISMFAALASVSPSIGMLGTVIGLVKLLGDMQDISALGPNMSMAMLSTLYGVFFNVAVFGPLNSRMQAMRDLQQKAYNQALFWVYLVENNKQVMLNQSQL